MGKNYESNRESNVTIIFQALSKMKPPLTRFAYVAALLVAAVYALVTLRGPQGIPAVIQKQHQIEQMEKSNLVLNQEIERKKDHIRRLTDNPAEQELEIRERLKLVHPNDKVYIIGQPTR